MKIACVGYRDWANRLYQNLIDRGEHEYLHIRSKKEYDVEKIIAFNPDYVLYYGWSWAVSEAIFNNYQAIMLHPSALPKFRGGSPIQNQIINGVVDSKVTLFIINEEYDAGDILLQKELSLAGGIDEIFERIVDVGTELTIRLLSEDIVPKKQNEEDASYYPRRKRRQSEITMDELLNQPGVYLYNKIRMLQDPYPNAFIRTSDGKRLLIQVAKLED